MGYTQQAIKGIGLMSILQFSIRGFTLVKIAVVATILAPADFGYFGMAMIVVGFFETFSDIGIQTFLIRHRGDIGEYVSTAWLVQIIRGVVLFLIILLIAQPAGLFFQSQFVALLILIGALLPLIKGFENPYIAVFQKELQFNREFGYRFSTAFVDVITSILLAYSIQSSMGLLLGLLVSTSFGVVLSWFVVKKHPLFVYHKSQFKEIFSFAKNITALGVVSYTLSQLDSIVVGRILGAGSLGIYQISQKFSSLPMTEIADVFNKVTLPVYSKISEDFYRLKRAYLRMFLFTAAGEFVIMLSVIFFARYILLLFGPEWVIADNLMRLFSVYGFFLALYASIGPLLFAIHKQEILVKLAFLRLIIVAPLIPFFVSVYGLTGALYALLVGIVVAAGAAAFWLLSFFGTKRHGLPRYCA